MADPEHLKILKRGVEGWNEWRKGHPAVRPDLRDAELHQTQYPGVNFSHALLNSTTFNRSDLRGANFRHAHFPFASLVNTDLRGVDFTQAHLSSSFLSGSELTDAIFERAILQHANFSDADCSGAKFNESELQGSIFFNTLLKGADFNESLCQQVSFSGVDLSEAHNLELIRHFGPSSVGVETIYKSRGNIPEVFLRGCGLSDWQIEQAKLYSLELSNEEITNILYRVHDLRAGHPLQISPLFISYTHTDSAFVDRLEIYLNKRGVRFWRDVHHSTAGRLETQIDRAIRLNPTVLLVLSEHSVMSDWVEHEARIARKLEQETGRDVLCPVALDDGWKTCRWPERLREQIMEYNVLDFSNWQDPDYMRRIFTRLIEGLGLFYNDKS